MQVFVTPVCNTCGDELERVTEDVRKKIDVYDEMRFISGSYLTIDENGNLVYFCKKCKKYFLVSKGDFLKPVSNE